MNDIFRGGSTFLLDGGMGTQLQASGLQPGEVPELWNLTRPDDVRAVHEAYFAAGSDAVIDESKTMAQLGAACGIDVGCAVCVSRKQ